MDERSRGAVSERAGGYDIRRVRKDFPVLSRKVYGKPLVYLDNAASAQKPQAVIDAVNELYTTYYSNVHRGVHALSDRSTRKYEEAREHVRRFISAGSIREIVFVKGATEAFNLVAQTFVKERLLEGDEVLITTMEHHSNIVPWQMLCGSVGAKLVVAPINDAGELLLDEFEKLVSPRTKFISVTHMSNALGTINPAKELVSIAHDKGVPIMFDGAQAAAHIRVDVSDLGCDFYAFSGHKLYGPTGVGVLYAKEEHLEAMPPYQGGGNMILSVTFEKTEYNDIPFRFEAGTPNIAGVVGMAAAIQYLERLGLEAVEAHEREATEYARELLLQLPEVRMIGAAKNRVSALSFTVKGVHPHDLGTLLDRDGVAIRAGHHCAQPTMLHFGVPATARASFALYNTKEEAETFVNAVKKAIGVFG